MDKKKWEDKIEETPLVEPEEERIPEEAPSLDPVPDPPPPQPEGPEVIIDGADTRK